MEDTIQIAIEMKSYSLSDRELSSVLHKLETLFYKKKMSNVLNGSMGGIVLKYQIGEIHKMLLDMKKENTTTKGRADALRSFINHIEDIFTHKELEESLESTKASIYYLMK